MRYRFILSILLGVMLTFPTYSSKKSEKIVTDLTKFNAKLVTGEKLVSKTVYTEDGHSIIEFKYTNCKQGNYHLEFWLCPAMHKDGTFEEYSIRVNNVPQEFKIKPTKADWHSTGLEEGQSVTFNNGENTIQVISEGKHVPNIEVIEASPISNIIHLESGNYNGFRSKLGDSNTLIKSNINSQIKAQQLSQNKIEYVQDETYNCYKNYPFTYTFHTSQYLDKGEHFEILTEQLGDFETIIYFFKTKEPDKYSWAIYPEEKTENPNDEPEDEYPTTEFKIYAPEAGFYTVLLKPLYRNESGFCNILVNQDVYYENVAVTGNTIYYKFNTDQEYNTFTYNYSGDPMLWIESIKSAENPSGCTTKIEAACDDGDGAENEDDESEWEVNPRIKRLYDSTFKYIWLTNYSSLNPDGICDLYLNCKNATGVLPYFKYLNPYDAILSGNASTIYNCISWSGGITSYWEWPGLEDSQFYSEDTLEAFDNFYDSRGLTREGANLSNALVALWAYVDKNGNREYSHASIRNGDGKLHGYSWESKPGNLERIFHPKDALRGKDLSEGYGQIVEYYRLKDNTFNAIRNGQASSLVHPELIEINYSSEEGQIIKEQINRIDTRIKNGFESLYGKFSDNVKGSIHSNPEFLIDCPEFKELMEYYGIHPECKFIVFDLLGDKELPAMLVFNKMGNTDNRLNAIRKSASKKAKAVNQENTYYPVQSNMMLNVKEYLKGLSETSLDTQVLTDCDFTVNIEGGQLSLEYSGQINEPVSIQIYDQYGNLIHTYSNVMPEAQSRYKISDLITDHKGISILKISTSEKVFTKKINL